MSAVFDNFRSFVSFHSYQQLHSMKISIVTIFNQNERDIRWSMQKQSKHLTVERAGLPIYQTEPRQPKPAQHTVTRDSFADHQATWPPRTPHQKRIAKCLVKRVARPPQAPRGASSAAKVVTPRRDTKGSPQFGRTTAPKPSYPRRMSVFQNQKKRRFEADSISQFSTGIKK